MLRPCRSVLFLGVVLMSEVDVKLGRFATPVAGASWLRTALAVDAQLRLLVRFLRRAILYGILKDRPEE